jgi:uncharacterized protein YjbJ (UPF0337 family)
MQTSTNDRLKGNLHKLKGKAKETIGQITKNPDLVAEGQAEQVAGAIQKKVGQIKKVFEK